MGFGGLLVGTQGVAGVIELRAKRSRIFNDTRCFNQLNDGIGAPGGAR